MMNTAPPSPSLPNVTDADVQWFGASSRLVGGQPDARYGWWDAPQGPCIVKAIHIQGLVYGASLLNNERRALAELNRQGAPVPQHIATNQADWLVTRFGGISLRQLEIMSQPARHFPFDEQLAVWVHFLRRAQALEASNALPVDLYGANLVLPLTETRHGQLRLNEVCSIDHAHTVVAGLNMRRPVWLDTRMKRVPPELAASLRHDQQNLIAFFRQHAAPLPGAPTPNPEQAKLAQRLWAEYDHPQTTQRLLDRGKLLPGKAMQYAVAVELGRLQPLAPPAMQAPLAALQERMQQPNPAERFDSLAQAAEQLARLLPHMPVVGRHEFAHWGPEQLRSSHAPNAPLQSSKTRAVAVVGLTAAKRGEKKPAETVTWRHLPSPPPARARAQRSASAQKPRRLRLTATHAVLLGTFLGVALAYLYRT
jgi:hypothetical protein